MKDLAKFYKQAVDWNTKSGSRYEEFGTYEWIKKVDNQNERLHEEVVEIKSAIEQDDMENFLQEVCDAFVCWAYLAEQLVQAGFDVEGALNKINEANNTKIFNSYTQAAESADFHEENGVDGVYIQSSLFEGKDYYTVRDINQKIRKPIGFQSVELKQYCPKE